jgi:hypothetical protein
MSEEKPLRKPYSYCETCHEDFDDSFEYVDHFLDDDEEEFDPYLTLPNGYKFMIGSLLRHIFYNAHRPEEIRIITQSAYVTLFASEYNTTLVKDLIENMVVDSEMVDFDDSLIQLLEEEKPSGNEEDKG